jgi:hypothetical protein
MGTLGSNSLSRLSLNGEARLEPSPNRWVAATALALLGMTLLINVYYLVLCGNGLSPVADPYSEANALRAGERFDKEGFTVNHGLPDVSYGRRFPEWGIHGSSGKDAEDAVYHGYPPGSDWLAGVYTRVFGIEHLARFRIIPVAFGMFAAAVFLLALMRTLGAVRGMAVYFGCLLAPMFTNMTHGLYYHGYSQSLLVFELAALMLILRRPGRLGAGPPALLFLLGFLHGWFSFDYCFVATFAAAPIAFLIGPADRPVAWRKVLALVLAAGLGFTIAHGLHFLQSVLYFGSAREAVEEYAFRSAKRYGLTASPLERMSKPALLAYGMWMYLRAFFRWTSLFGPAAIVLMEWILGVFVLRRVQARLGRRIMVEADMAPTRRDLAGLALAFLVGTTWLFAKPFHALNHLTFNGRHLFLFYFACCLVIARATVLIINREPETDRADEQVDEEALAAARG